MPHAAFHLEAAGEPVRRLSTTDGILRAIAGGRGLIWVHITQADAADATLLQRLGFHPLAIEDALSEQYRRPKVEEYGDHLFLVLHGIDDEQSVEAVQTTELDLFVGPRLVVSSSTGTMPWCEPLVEHHAQIMERGAATLTYAIIDALVDSVLPPVERMEEIAEVLEEHALEHPTPEILDHIVRLKRSAALVHRVMVPQQEVIARIARGDYPLLDDGQAAYFRDVVDHLARIEDFAHGVRDRADYLVLTYHSALSLRQNEAMRQLAIVASIFMPLTLLTGIYGMNFDHMPELGWRYGYFAVLAVIIGVVGAGTGWMLAHARRWRRPAPPEIASFTVDAHRALDVARRSGESRVRVLGSTTRDGRAPSDGGPPVP